MHMRVYLCGVRMYAVPTALATTGGLIIVHNEPGPSRPSRLANPHTTRVRYGPGERKSTTVASASTGQATPIAQAYTPHSPSGHEELERTASGTINCAVDVSGQVLYASRFEARPPLPRTRPPDLQIGRAHV